MYKFPALSQRGRINRRVNSWGRPRILVTFSQDSVTLLPFPQITKNIFSFPRRERMG